MMNMNDLETLWRTQNDDTVRLDLLALSAEARRGDAELRSIIRWRDAREIVVLAVMIPMWVFQGILQQLPWTWYLGIPAFLFTAVFMIKDRVNQKRREPSQGAFMREYVEGTTEYIQHQVWLLKNVLRWYLLPTDLALFAFFISVGWEARHESVAGAVIIVLILMTITAIFSWAVYRLNQRAVRKELLPRLREARKLLRILKFNESNGSL